MLAQHVTHCLRFDQHMCKHLLQYHTNQQTLACCPADIPPWWIWFCELLSPSDAGTSA